MANSNNKTIAKNTSLLYIGMLFNMVVALFTSRVVLQTLGVEDFGIFQIVGGAVSMFAFLNSALSTGSERFLTYELGTGNYEKLKKTFSTVLTAHIILALIVIVVLETIGLWYVYKQVNIPAERMDAAIVAYHVSVLALFFTFTQIPYNASIISHEKMGAFAYISILEVSLKLAIAYFLYISPWDKLVVYAWLYCGVHVLIALGYRLYCIKHFEETHYTPQADKKILREVLSYSGWNLLDNSSIALNNHGATLLLGTFFNPSVVAARAVANQVNMATHQFMNNFRKAFTPQVVKRYAAGDYESCKQLLLSSTRYTYYLMLCLCLPICLTAHQLLELWLGIVPEYADTFLQLIVITSIFQSFNASFYTALYANGQIRENAIYSSLITILFLPITYVLFKMGYSPILLSAVQMLLSAVIGLIVKPIIVIKIVKYTWKDIFSVYLPCIKVTIAAILLPLIYYYFIQDRILTDGIAKFFAMAGCCVICSLVAIWYLGLSAQIRTKLVQVLRNKVLRK